MARVSVHRARIPLKRPYNLAFGPVTHLESFFVVRETDAGIGLGEATPLPGYGAETAETVARALVEACRGDEPVEDSPMAMSAWASSHQTLRPAEAWNQGGPELPLVALCDGETPEDLAAAVRNAAAEGFEAVKIKLAAHSGAEDLARLKAVADITGIELRADANQGLDPADAVPIAALLAEIPNSRLEQPFPPGAEDACAALVRETDVALVLDESIWSADDLDRATAARAMGVKLKLCKHDGPEALSAMVEAARGRGLEITLGNGVQSALGNYLEAEVQADLGLSRALESVGFAKLAGSPFGHGLSVRNGKLINDGLSPPTGWDFPETLFESPSS